MEVDPGLPHRHEAPRGRETVEEGVVALGRHLAQAPAAELRWHKRGPLPSDLGEASDVVRVGLHGLVRPPPGVRGGHEVVLQDHAGLALVLRVELRPPGVEPLLHQAQVLALRDHLLGPVLEDEAVRYSLHQLLLFLRLRGRCLRVVYGDRQVHVAGVVAVVQLVEPREEPREGRLPVEGEDLDAARGVDPRVYGLRRRLLPCTPPVLRGPPQAAARAGACCGRADGGGQQQQPQR
mmetsp:Transcript_8765/g.26981  ORF Transcript_8765/g.26981 Transcript_8765/m.26981 type:complete len:236 (-) Transcript_8765:74-781(-)